MELYEHRILNGVLKDVEAVQTPEAAQALLKQDVEVYVEPSRTGQDDLWPCVWALSAALSKQFCGNVFIRSDSCECRTGPPKSSSRIVYSRGSSPARLRIGIGAPPPNDDRALWGDARGNRISLGRPLDRHLAQAHPISCFSLAGYLGFALLASAVGIPPFQHELAKAELRLPFVGNEPTRFPSDGIAFLGLGQLGQAYLALLFFLTRTSKAPAVLLLDKDEFEAPNYSTQILLSEDANWDGAPKSQYLDQLVRTWGWNGTPEFRKLTWGFKKSPSHPRLAFLGFDRFEPRRIAIESGFEWLVEAGIGRSFAKPRATWHSLPPDRGLASRIFPQDADVNPEPGVIEKQFYEDLRQTPGECGWVTFNDVRASAPSMGLVAAAYAWAEMLQVLDGKRIPTAGTCYLWSPLLPFCRTPLAL
jgi:hypothetical protein